MDKSCGHAAVAHSTRYSFDGVIAHVTGREHIREAGLQRKWLAIEFQVVRSRPWLRRTNDHFRLAIIRPGVDGDNSMRFDATTTL